MLSVRLWYVPAILQRAFMKQSLNRPYGCLFGPVRSRRLGVSLGVDLVPSKTCTLDCIYCECGKTTRKTLFRKAHIPTREILDELNDFLSGDPELDHVTFSGAGEPTLHSGIGELIRFLKNHHPRYPVALLTNGTLLFDPAVRKDIADADQVIASLDAATPEGFHAVNRPHPDLHLAEIIEGLIAFRQGFVHRLLIEIFIVPGLNDTEAEITALKTVLERIRPDGVHLNTLDRPGTEFWVMPARKAALERISGILGGDLARFSIGSPRGKGVRTISEKQLARTLFGRPCTAEDIAAVFGIKTPEARRLLDGLVNSGRAEKRQMPRGVFYFARKNAGSGKTG